MDRLKFWLIGAVAASSFFVLFSFIKGFFGAGSPVSFIIYPPYIWTVFVICARRYHDIGKSVWSLLLLLIPLIGPIWVSITLGFRTGTDGDNQYGPDPKTSPDYLVVN